MHLCVFLQLDLFLSSSDRTCNFAAIKYNIPSRPILFPQKSVGAEHSFTNYYLVLSCNWFLILYCITRTESHMVPNTGSLKLLKVSVLGHLTQTRARTIQISARACLPQWKYKYIASPIDDVKLQIRLLDIFCAYTCYVLSKYVLSCLLMAYVLTVYSNINFILLSKHCSYSLTHLE